MASSPHRHPMSTQTLVLSHFANLKLAGDRVVRDAVHSIQRAPSAELSRPTRQPRPSRKRRTRRYKHASSRRVNAMSDADLEAELAARRAARARERDRYAKAMRSEKLALLESELSHLRSEISRMDRATPLGGGTPPTARWEQLPHDRRSSRGARPRPTGYPSSSPIGSPPLTSSPVTPALPSRAAPGAPSGPPPMPPPPPPSMPAMDQEKQKREKLERQRRREAKRKEREAAKKPLTLADIIKSAGPNPASRLKPSGSTPLQDVNDEEEDEKTAFANLKDSLTKSESATNTSKKPSDSDPEKKSDDTSAESEQQQLQSVKKDKNESTGERTNSSATKKLDQSDEPNPSDKNQEILKDTATASKDFNMDARAGTQKPLDKDIHKAKSAVQDDKPKLAADEGAEKSVVKEHPDNNDQAPIVPKQPSLSNGTRSEANGSMPTDSTGESPEKPPGDANDAVSALSALTAKLPKKSPSASTSDMMSNDFATDSKRLSVQEKRRLRRAARDSASSKND